MKGEHMPTARFKPWNKRKPYCRKKGGGAFQFKGGRKEARATANFLGARPQEQQGIIASNVKTILQKMGFRVGAK